MRASLASLVGILLTVSIASTAHAQPAGATRGEAAERFDRALRLVNAGDLSGALAEFQRAYSLQPASVVMYNVGLVYAALNRPVEAVRALQKATSAPDDPLKPDNAGHARDVMREQSDKIGQVELTTNAKEGVVEVDNVELAKLPVTGPIDIAVGPHVIGVVSPGYAPARREVLVAGRAKVDVHFEMVAIEGLLAHIAVACRVPAADVLVDGERVGKTPLEATITVAPGAHQVEVRRAGYTAAPRAITLQDGARADVALDPVVDKAALAREGGWLDVRASESQAVVTIDGQEMGLVTGPIQYPAGPHRLHVERGGFLAAERDVVIPLGATSTIPIVFEPTPDTRAHYVSSAQSRRTWSWVTLGAGVALAAGGVAFALIENGQIPDAQSTLDAVNFDWTPRLGRVCDHTQALTDDQIASCAARLNDATNKINDLKTGRTVGWVAAGVGGAVAITGLVLLLTGDDPHRFDEKPSDKLIGDWRVVPQVGPGGGAVFVGASF